MAAYDIGTIMGEKFTPRYGYQYPGPGYTRTPGVPASWGGPEKGKVYVPIQKDINKEAYTNPSADYRNTLLATAQGTDRAAPTMDTAGFEKAGLGYEEAKSGYRQGLVITEKDRARALAARAQQLEALDLSRIAAEGGAPSSAALQQRAGVEQALASQIAMANSARGGAGAGMMATREAAMNAAGIQQKAINDAAILRAQEMQQARGEYLAGTGQLRQSDFAAEGLGLQQAGLANQYAAEIAKQQGLALQPATTQAQLEAQQRQLAAQQQLGLYGLVGGVDTRTQQAMMGLSEAEQAQQNFYQQLMTGQMVSRYGAEQGVSASLGAANIAANAQETAAWIGLAGAGLGALSTIGQSK